MSINWYNPNRKASSVSIATYGLLFSGGAIDALGTPQYIILGFSKDDNELCVKPEEAKTENAVEFGSKIKNDYVRINDKNFIQFLISQLDPSFKFSNIAQKFNARWDDDKKMLTVKITNNFEERPDESEDEIDPFS